MTTNNTFSNQKRDENNTFYKTNVANNVAQRNSQDLTEQWKKGKLETGEEYWVILTDELYLLSPGVPVRAFYSCNCEFEGYLDNDIKQVLAPVPSYEQWQAKLEENQRLEELLKECVGELAEFNNSYYPKTQALITKINEVLK